MLRDKQCQSGERSGEEATQRLEKSASSCYVGVELVDGGFEGWVGEDDGDHPY